MSFRKGSLTEESLGRTGEVATVNPGAKRLGLEYWPANRCPALRLPFKDKGTCVLSDVPGAAAAEQDKWLAPSRTDL